MSTQPKPTSSAEIRKARIHTVQKLLTPFAKKDSEIMSIAESLFLDAPDELVEASNAEALFKIASETAKFFKKFLAGKEPFAIELLQDAPSGREGKSAVVTVIKDSPYIIDTLTEFFRTNDLNHQLLLHPIITHQDGELYSLVYAEIDHVENKVRQDELRSTLSLHFDSLRLTTRDFQLSVEKAERVAAVVEGLADGKDFDQEECLEAAEFLRWLAEDRFVFLGYQEWSVASATASAEVVDDSRLGLFCSEQNFLKAELAELNNDVAHLIKKKYLIYFSKLLLESPVHRTAKIDVIIVRLAPLNDKPARVACFIGLLTPRAISQEAARVPVIRKKLERILENENLSPNTYKYKEAISIADSLPKTEWLRSTEDSLQKDVQLILSIQRRHAVRVIYRMGPLKRFISFIIVIPRERLAAGMRTKIQSYFEQLVGADRDSSDFRISVDVEHLAIIHLLVPNPSFKKQQFDSHKLEQDVINVMCDWNDEFSEILNRMIAPSEARQIAASYLAVIPESYKTRTSCEEAVNDVLMLESLTAQDPLAIDVVGEIAQQGFDLKFFKLGQPFTLSGILPILENVGLSVIRETSHTLNPAKHDSLTINVIRVVPKSELAIDTAHFKKIVIPALRSILLGEHENDSLNQLLLAPGLDARAVAVFRTACRYLLQIKASPSERILFDAITQNSISVEILNRYFVQKFDPALSLSVEQREAKLAELRAEFLQQLNMVHRLSDDRALRALFNVFESVVRTNFYQSRDDMRVVFKINCSKIEKLPLPRPFFEIFVTAPDFEGVHLRGGMVARGGLRWSERLEDYRTEVLGLVKTQTVKNSIIIPTGAKGGFVVKLPLTDPATSAAIIRECYSRFIESLLLVTDNRVQGEIKPPANTVRYDGDDPYLVVAADKGTAVFSDLANSIATERFNFWLGDAFASGGSNGYDHKKLAITACGAWETTCRHFRELGRDIEKEPFTLVGIGDMSGDVFGNGLLRSRYAKLIAAFNHKHIFIDPTPDAEVSFKERERLFNLPRSQWSDYDSKLISNGGGVYDRAQKSIALSKEAQDALGITESSVSPDDLIKAILLAPVDLIWNGGIGTYFKSEKEDNASVGDRANDEVRVNAKDLRALAIGEGGNLGSTQLARIEYAQHGGRINTDAVDNSGGVNLSDIEVNLKILLSAPASRKEISVEERNEILVQYAKASCEQVLNRNRSQSKVISLELIRSRKSLNAYRALIAALEKDGRLDRKSEFLPDEEKIKKRTSQKLGLYRPEIAVFLGYSRMWLTDEILNSVIPEHPLAQRFLTRYFPSGISERFASDVMAHPLKREIIATQIANYIIDRVGACFVFRTSRELALSQKHVIAALLVAAKLLQADTVAEEIEKLDTAKSSELHLQAELALGEALETATIWILEYCEHKATLHSDPIEGYRQTFVELSQQAEALFSAAQLQDYSVRNEKLLADGFSPELTKLMLNLSFIAEFLDVIHLAKKLSIEEPKVAAVYFNLAQLLSTREILNSIAELVPADHWELLALRGMVANFRRALARITRAAIDHQAVLSDGNLEGFLKQRNSLVQRYLASCEEIKSGTISLASFTVLTRQLNAISGPSIVV